MLRDRCKSQWRCSRKLHLQVILTLRLAVNAIDMDGGIDAWKAKFPASKYPKAIKTLKNTSVKDSTGKDFSMERYRETQLAATKSMEKGAKRMIECIRSVQNVGSKKWDKASLTPTRSRGDVKRSETMGM